MKKESFEFGRSSNGTYIIQHWHINPIISFEFTFKNLNRALPAKICSIKASSKWTSAFYEVND